MAERSHSTFPKKGDLGSASNYRGITLMAVGAEVYNRIFLIGLDAILTQSCEIIRMVSEKVGLQLRSCLLYVDW